MTVIARSFNRAAQSYATHSELQQQSARDLIHLAGPLLVQNTVLELGAGTGYCTAHLLAAGNQVVAVEPAPQMLAQLPPHPLLARLNLSMEAVSASTFQQTRVIFSNFVLHWCHPVQVQRQLAVCHPGTWLVSAIPVSGSLAALKEGYPEVPWMTFAAAPDWLAAFEGWSCQNAIHCYSKTFESFRQLTRYLKRAGGRQTTPEQAVIPQIYRTYLSDIRPAVLEYEVLMLLACKN